MPADQNDSATSDSAGGDDGQAAGGPTLLSSHRWGEALIEQYALSNGLQVLVWEDHNAPVFAYQTWFRVGSAYETPGRTGIAHLFEHLMFKATENHPEGEFDRLMEAQGAQTNAATWVDWTYYRQKLPVGNLSLVAELEADRMAHLLLNTTQLESEREVVKNERLLRVDNDPEGQLYEELYALAFEKHPYGSPTIGWMPDIQALSLDDCNAFYRLHYAPNTATVAVVGAVDTAEVLQTIQRFYGHLEAQPVPSAERPEEPRQTAERRKVLELDVAAEKAVYAYHAPKLTDPQHPALEVLNEILAVGDSSRIHQKLVVELELASSIGGWVASWQDPGLYELSLQLHPDKTVAEIEPVFEELLVDVARDGVTQRELDKAKNAVEADFLRGMADVGQRARGLGDAQTTVGDYRFPFEQAEALRAVTLDQVRKVARDVLRPSNRSVIIARPPAAPTVAPTAARVADGEAS